MKYEPLNTEYELCELDNRTIALFKLNDLQTEIFKISLRRAYVKGIIYQQQRSAINILKNRGEINAN